MIKKKEIIVFLVFFGIIFSGIFFLFNPSDLPNMETLEEDMPADPQETTKIKTSGDHVPFVIDDTGASGYTWTEAKAAGICSGSGTIGDPYIIEGLSIDGERLVECITIKNSIKHFVIRDCLVFNSKLRPSGQVVYFGGIRLANVQNGILTDNEAINNEAGIYLTNSDYNLITNNKVNNNGAAGILLTSCDHNEITGNQFNNNKGSGIFFGYGASHNNIIFNNTASYNSGYRGITLHGTYNVIDTNTFSHNYVGLTIGGSYNTIANNMIGRSSSYGMQIMNSNNFQIINNKVTLTTNGIYMYNIDSMTISSNDLYGNIVGINLHKANNNQILENYIHENTNDGIRIHSTSHNNIISNNLLEGNLRGINSASSSNLFYKNYLMSNSQNARDNGNNNQWDNGNIGNYWDNYSGIDADYDGIGDTPHIIFGSAGSQDNFPMFNAYPDFTISQNDIKLELGIGETDVLATITNIGFTFEGIIKISFLEELPDNTTRILENKTLINLKRFESKTVSIRWTPRLFHFLIVSIDPENLIVEYDKNNNVAKRGGGGNTPTIGNVWSYFGKWFDMNTVGNFFKSLYLINTFYVEIIDLDGPDDVAEVTFKIGNKEYNGILHEGNIWKFGYNMGNLTQGDNTLEITARDTLDLVSETRIIIIKVIEIPSWITDFTDVIFNYILPDWIRIEGFTIYITFEVGAEGGSKTLPDDIPNVGGGDMGPEIKITFTFSFNLLTLEAQLKVAGSFEFETSLGGRDVKISIEVSGTGDFGPGFVLERLEIKIKLELSLTVWGYGVSAAQYFKVGIGLDLEFKFALTFIFKVIDNILQWAESNLELQIGILGWAEFKLDLGFIGVTARGEAGGGIILDFIWSETEGFSWGFDLYLRVGYIFELKFLWWKVRYSGSYEWRLFDRSPAEMNKTVVEIPLNYTKDYSTLMDSRPRVATDKNGKAMMVWTHNRNETGKIYTDLCYSTWNGTDWDDARYITFDNHSDFDPALAYDSNGNVIVTWSRFRDDVDTLTAEDPIDLLESQEIAYSMWDGSTWTEPQLITNGTYANGRAVVSAGQNGDLLAVWVGDPDHNFTTTKDMELFYSIWNGTHWSAEKQLTNNEHMDYSASLAHDSMGNSMLCWIRDLDGNRSTTSDNQLLYSLWEGNGWSEPSKVIESDESKESPSITYDLNDNLLITWVGRNETMSKLYFASWNKTTEEWSAPEIVHEEGFFIFNPAINVDPNNTAVIVWRGFEDDAAEKAYYLTHNATDTYFDGELCYATKDLTRHDSVWSELKYLTSNNKTDWMASAVIIKGHSNDLLLVWDMDGIVNNLVHEIKPDLFVNSSDIFFSNEHPMEGEAIDITATVYNIGDVEAKDISVYFYNGDPKNGGYLIGTALIDLDYDEKINVTIPWVAQPGSNNIYVVVDHENLISEINEDNNIAFNKINILPDLTLSSTDISFSNPNPLEGEDITIKALIHNQGGTKAENVIVEFYDDNGYIGNYQISALDPYETEEAFVQWKVPAGLNNITVIIDPTNNILEWNETNNNATTTLFVYPDIKLIDFNISNDILIYGDSVELTGEIQNIGATSANNILLEFYDGNPNIDGVLLDSIIIPSLDIGQKTSFSYNWIEPPPGIHKVFAIIDRQNAIDESDETNNLLYQELMVLNLPDLTISEPEFAYTTDYIEINIPVENIGGGGATGVVLDLYDGNPLIGGELWFSHLFTYIGAGQSEIASLKLFRLPRFEDLYIIVDLIDNIEELSEANNQLIIHYADIIKVDAGPDQQVEEGEIVHFTATLYGGFSGVFTYLWDFGDGSSGEGKNPTHQYGDNGIYNVLLTVTAPNFVGTDDLTLTVSNVAPIVDAGLDQTVNEDDTVSFSGTFSDPGIMDTYTFLWDFGDGSPTVTGTLLPSHVYAVPGTYIVSLTVTDDDGGTCTDSLVVTVLDITPPTTTLTFLGLYYISDYTYISSTATEILLDAEDTEMPDGSGVDIIQYQIDTVTGSWVTYTGLFTIDLIGSHTIYYRSIDKAGNIESPKSVDVVVNASELTYTGEVNGVYSDPVILNATLIDIATQLPIPGKIIVFTLGDQTASAVTLSDGVATVTIILDQPGGSYSVSASFTGDETYLASSDIHAFTLEKEHVYAIYTGSTVVPTTADTITLRATVFDEDDGNWGDLTKIHVTFSIYDENYILSETHSLWVEITNIDGVGVAIIEILKNLNEGSYLVKISFDPSENDYYQGPDSDFVVLVIYKPTGDFVTGGGWIEDTEGNKGNFGFNIKYKKNGLPKGQAIYVYREGDFIFIVKANAWIGMAIDHDDNHAFFEAKCNIKQINSTTGEIVWEKGNYRLRIDVWDHSKDGKNDVFQIRVYDKIGLVYHEAGFEPYGFLQGGNIVIHVDDKKK